MKINQLQQQMRKHGKEDNNVQNMKNMKTDENT